MTMLETPCKRKETKMKHVLATSLLFNRAKFLIQCKRERLFLIVVLQRSNRLGATWGGVQE